MLIFIGGTPFPWNSIEQVNLSSWPIEVKKQAVALFKKDDSIGLLHHIHCHGMEVLPGMF
jgi:hypothetical protein